MYLLHPRAHVPIWTAEAQRIRRTRGSVCASRACACAWSRQAKVFCILLHCLSFHVSEDTTASHTAVRSSPAQLSRPITSQTRQEHHFHISSSNTRGPLIACAARHGQRNKDPMHVHARNDATRENGLSGVNGCSLQTTGLTLAQEQAESGSTTAAPVWVFPNIS